MVDYYSIDGSKCFEKTRTEMAMFVFFGKKMYIFTDIDNMLLWPSTRIQTLVQFKNIDI